LNTIAYTFATKCFKYLKIAYCLCFKRVDRRRNQRLTQRQYQNGTEYAHTRTRYKPAGRPRYTRVYVRTSLLHIRKGHLNCPVNMSGQFYLGSWMRLRRRGRLTTLRGQTGILFALQRSEGAVRDGGDSCLLSASAQTFCDL